MTKIVYQTWVWHPKYPICSGTTRIPRRPKFYYCKFVAITVGNLSGIELVDLPTRREDSVLTRRLTLSSSASTWLKPDIGAKKMMMLTRTKLVNSSSRVFKGRSSVPSSKNWAQVAIQLSKMRGFNLITTHTPLASTSSHIIDCPLFCLLRTTFCNNYMFFGSNSGYTGFQYVVWWITRLHVNQPNATKVGSYSLGPGR